VEPADPRTESEKKFDESQKKREKDRVGKIAENSHRRKIEDYNKYLDSLPNHFDIPKVGPG